MKGDPSIRHLAYAHGKPLYWWAWQFLRRNADYRADWQTQLGAYVSALDAFECDPQHHEHPEGRFFVETVLDHGHKALRPGHPDFCISLTDASLTRWGLVEYLNPDTETPARLYPMPFRPVVGLGDRTNERGEAAVDHLHTFTFDLSKPLGPQLEQAHADLLFQQQRTVSHDRLNVSRVRVQPEHWPHYLEVLDARHSGASWRDLMTRFSPEELAADISPADSSVRKDYAAAMKLVNGGYHAIADTRLLIYPEG